MTKKDIKNSDDICQGLDVEQFVEFISGCDLGYRMGLTGCDESIMESTISQANPEKKPALCWGICRGFMSAVNDIKRYKKVERENALQVIGKSKENEKGLDYER